MCARTRYTTDDDQLILDMVSNSKNKCIAFEKAAKKLNRTPNAIFQRYYGRLKMGKARPVRKQIMKTKTDKITGAQKAVINVNGVEITVLFK